MVILISIDRLHPQDSLKCSKRKFYIGSIYHLLANRVKVWWMCWQCFQRVAAGSTVSKIQVFGCNDWRKVTMVVGYLCLMFDTGYPTDNASSNSATEVGRNFQDICGDGCSSSRRTAGGAERHLHGRKGASLLSECQQSTFPRDTRLKNNSKFGNL